MVGLLDQALDDANLFEAWLKVRANKGRRGEYRPQPLLRVGIPKTNGKLRYLAIPTVRDRVLQTAVARVITPLLDRAFEHASYGYRSGHSVAKAVARVAYWRDQGYHWVVDADIQSYFDNIDHALLLEKLRRTISDHSLLPLIELWLAATVQPADLGEQPFGKQRPGVARHQRGAVGKQTGARAAEVASSRGSDLAQPSLVSVAASTARSACTNARGSLLSGSNFRSASYWVAGEPD